MTKQRLPGQKFLFIDGCYWLIGRIRCKHNAPNHIFAHCTGEAELHPKGVEQSTFFFTEN